MSDKPEQPLYEVVVSLSRGDEIVDGKIVKIGLRDLVFDNSPDEIGKNFRFTLNGVPLFIKARITSRPTSRTFSTGKMPSFAFRRRIYEYEYDKNIRRERIRKRVFL
ncbi:MAG: hypothetical protein L6V82_04375 [Clostridiales bacterium]|nr:MAG: hypothetical protein L6V82_04375 [Clostridiales bacterium]